MQRFTFIALFVAHTPVENTGQVENSGLDTIMVKAMVSGVIDGYEPFTGTSNSHGEHLTRLLIMRQRISNSQKLQGVILNPLQPCAPEGRTIVLWGLVRDTQACLIWVNGWHTAYLAGVKAIT